MYNCIICGHSTKKVLIPVNTCVAPMGNKLVNFSLLECKFCGHLQKKIDKNWLKGIKNLYEKKYKTNIFEHKLEREIFDHIYLFYEKNNIDKNEKSWKLFTPLIKNYLT